MRRILADEVEKTVSNEHETSKCETSEPETKKSRFADMEDSDSEDEGENILTGSSAIAKAELEKYLVAKYNDLNSESLIMSGTYIPV